MKRWIKAHSRILKITIVSLLLAHAVSGVIILSSENWKWGFYIFASCFWFLLLLGLTGILHKIYEWWERD